jgi:hypothetical protein
MMKNFGKNNHIIQRLFLKENGKSAKWKYSESIRTFVLALNFFSPKAYSYVRSEFASCLPRPKTLGKWYSTIDAKPGNVRTESTKF